MQRDILIVDDDRRNIFALTAVLKAKGYAIRSASDAAEGIEMMRKEASIGYVLLDMMMPDMDGYEALSVIRSDERTARLPVFAVTAQAMKGDRERCLEAGADEYLSKPVDVDRLLQLLQQYEAPRG